MDQKTIEINNLRVLHDYLNQTLDALSRTPRTAPWGQSGQAMFGGAWPFGGMPAGVSADAMAASGMPPWAPAGGVGAVSGFVPTMPGQQQQSWFGAQM